jgi:hypothetical protein
MPNYEGFSEIDVVRRRKVIVLVMLFANIREKIIVFDIECAALVEKIEDTLVQSVQKLDYLDVVGKV